MSNLISELDNEAEHVNADFGAKIKVVSTVSRKEIADRREAREQEIQRLGMQIAVARNENKLHLTSELLAFLGIIHNEPHALRRWENQ